MAKFIVLSQVFFVSSGIIGLILALVAGTLVPANSWIALGVGVGVTLWVSTMEFLKQWPHQKKWNFWEWAVLVAFALFCFRQFGWIYFEKSGGIWSANVFNLGDLSYHLILINNFLKGVSFWPANPLLQGETLNYPFGVDLVTAMLVQSGLSISQALLLCGVVGSVGTFIALYIWAGSFGVAAFLFSGGAAGLAFLSSGILMDYQADIPWKSLPLALLIPQRGFLVGFPVGLLLLTVWRNRFQNKKPLMPGWLEGCLWGALPFFHLHTFLFVSTIYGIWFLFSRRQKADLVPLLVAFFPATLLVVALTNGFSKASLLWVKGGWMYEGSGLLEFLWMNFGLYIPLAIWVTYLAIVQKSRQYLLEVIPALGIAGVCSFVMFAPWEWDNIKILVWCYLMLLPAISYLVLKPLSFTVRSSLCVCLFFTGILTIISTYRTDISPGFQLAINRELDTVCLAFKKIPAGRRVAAAQSFNHPVPLCGEAVAVGYSGWMWSHGLNFTAKEQDLRSLMLGEENWEQSAEALEADYLFWGPREAKEFAQSQRPWEKTRKKIAEGVWGSLYDLKNEIN